jgi:hypothetical protein
VTWVQPAHENNPARPSRVTYDLDTLGPLVKLTVTHADLEPGAVGFVIADCGLRTADWGLGT